LQAPRFDSTEVGAALGGPVSHLGSGTFGDTWRHGDTAVKIMCGEPLPPERLQREVGGLSRVSSPYVVRLDAIGRVELSGREYQALVFEYIRGDDVAKRIAAGRLPSTAEAEAFLRGLLTGVGHMHDKKTVHRDIKPANVALRGDDWSRPVLLDLGLARGDEETTITAYGFAVGTKRYMAPEVLRGQPQRPPADLFAVGVTVREALAGRHPFYDPGTYLSPAEMIDKIASGPCPLPAGVPAHVEELLDRLTDSRKAPRGTAYSCLGRLDGEGAAA
jgi:serine/threonine-protein kinase